MRVTPERAMSRLQVECWCGRKVIWLPAERIAAGQTGSCKHPECTEHYAGPLHSAEVR